MSKSTNLRWLVYRHDLNKDAIVTFNIFEHYRFADDVESSLKYCEDRDDFAKLLRKSLSYYFELKSEYETIIVPWIGSKETTSLRIDIYDQVMLNWDVFLDYVWTSGKEGSDGV
jgi:hypothetical protein